MNSKNSKTFKPHVLILNFSDKIELRRSEKSIALSNFSIYHTWKNIKTLYNINKIKLSAPTWNAEFELPGGSYSISDIPDYFDHILKKHGENIDNSSIRIYVNKIENRITFKIKTRYYIELLTPKTMKPKIKMVKMYHIQILRKQYQFTAILSIMIINNIREFCIHLFLMNHLVVYQKFLQKIISF